MKIPQTGVGLVLGGLLALPICGSIARSNDNSVELMFEELIKTKLEEAQAGLVSLKENTSARKYIDDFLKKNTDSRETKLRSEVVKRFMAAISEEEARRYVIDKMGTADSVDAKLMVQKRMMEVAAGIDDWGEKSHRQRIASVEADDDQHGGVPYKIFFSTGALFRNSYEVSYDAASDSATLTKTGDSSAYYLQFSYVNRYVLRRGEKDPGKRREKPYQEVLEHHFPFSHFPDIETHIGFVFANSSGPTNFSASTLAGSGDFNASGTLAFPFLRYSKSDATGSSFQSHQFAIELGGGVITDKNFLIVHPNTFVGGSYTFSFSPFGGANPNNAGYLMARFGYGWVDVPKYVPGSDNLDIEVERTIPQFEFARNPTLGTFLAYPLVNDIYLTVGANVYFTGSPASWNVSVGATIPLSNIRKTFSAFVGDSDEGSSVAVGNTQAMPSRGPATTE